MTTPTTLKIPDGLKTRIDRLAKSSGKSAHRFMVLALEREVAREERVREFVAEALESDAAIESGEAVYGADEVHDWLDRLAAGNSAKRPAAWRE